MSKHTPGPWALEIEAKDEFTQEFILQSANQKCGEPGDPSAFIGRLSFFAGEQDEANAHLIAAAPDMLEALELVEIMMRNQLGNQYKNSEYGRIVAAAIAKARGES